MLIGMLGLVVLGVFSNILYYEYMVIKTKTPDKDLMSGYLDLYRKKYGSR